ncbi:hypothetical protein [Actinoplanes aureus]|nr:hypothetical protein [Actinoplanes aureus]
MVAPRYELNNRAMDFAAMAVIAAGTPAPPRRVVPVDLANVRR